MLVEQEFQKLDLIAAYNHKVDPCYYIMILIFSIFALFLSIWYITFVFLNADLQVKGRVISNFMD